MGLFCVYKAGFFVVQAGGGRRIMIQINGLSITHRKNMRVILDNFSLVLNDKDKAVIIGEEGNGKSTLMKWLYDPELVEDYTDCQGVRITGNERLGYLPQELPLQDKEKTVYEFFSESGAFWSQTPKDIAIYARDFKLTPEFFYRSQKMGSLSGGEKIKAQLVKILMQEPTVLLLDEPSNDIDIITLELLGKLVKDWEHAVLFISHDETLIEDTADMVIHIEQIQRKTKSRYTVAHMPYCQYVEERLHKFEKQKQQAINDRKEKKARDAKYQRILDSVGHALGSASRQSPAEAKNLKDKMHTVKSMGKRFEREDGNMTRMPDQEEAIFFKLGDKKNIIPAGKTVIEYNLTRLMSPGDEASGGGRFLAKDIFLRVRGAQKVCITGANGSGKTTLLKKIKDVLMARDDIRVEYMPQDYEELLEPGETPVDFLDTSGDKAVRTRIRTYLGSLKYTADEMEHPIRELSGGQKAKVLLLKMSLSDANVLVLDEPTRNFSPLSGPVIRKMIKEFPGAVISISHDRKYISEVCDNVYELTENGLIYLEDKQWAVRK